MRKVKTEDTKSQFLDKDRHPEEEKTKTAIEEQMERGKGLCLKRGLNFAQWTVIPAHSRPQLLTPLYPLSPHEAPPTARHSASPRPSVPRLLREPLRPRNWTHMWSKRLQFRADPRVQHPPAPLPIPPHMPPSTLPASPQPSLSLKVYPFSHLPYMWIIVEGEKRHNFRPFPPPPTTETLHLCLQKLG